MLADRHFNLSWNQSRLHALVPTYCKSQRYKLDYGLRDRLHRLLTPKLDSKSVLPSMSNHSDEAISTCGAASESFWEPGNYKKTTKRVEDGFRLCNDLVQLIQERCDIEKNYAKSLHGWSKRWNDTISRGPEYGTTEAAWKAVLSESDRLQELHLRVKDKLLDNVVREIKQWQKDKFHKSMMAIKEKRELDEEFKRVQKPWAKVLERVNKCKQEYHSACKNERTLVNQERNAAQDSSFSLDQLKKIKERVSRAREEVTRCKEKYELALKEIGQLNPRYVTEMSQVFEKCQEMEEERLRFFKDVLFDIHDCLNISKDPELPNIYEEFRHTLQNADAAKDLKWWSSTYGVGMSMSWPQFEAFSEEFRDIIKDPKAKKVGLSNDGVTLINQHKFNEELPEWNDSFTTTANGSVADGGGGSGVGGGSSGVAGAGGDIASNQNMNRNSASNSSSIIHLKVTNATNTTVTDNNANLSNLHHPHPHLHQPLNMHQHAVSVRALYDYEGAEADELTFKQGDVFEKLEDEDEQGWCKGRKGEQVGLYPANYVEVLTEIERKEGAALS